MTILDRVLEKQILQKLSANKVVVLLGARRIGKTVLLTQVMGQLDSPYLFLNGEDFETIELLERRSIQHYISILGDRNILIIDEAQKVPEIGKILKLIVDGIKGIKILVTGSSAFDISKFTGEPLTGRKKTFYMFPLSERELSQIEGPVEQRANLREIGLW